MIGKYVIVRSNEAGVFFGILSAKEGTELTLTNARKVYYWSGAACVEEMSQHGIQNLKDSKLTIFVDTIIISNYVQILFCSEEAIENIKNAKSWTIK